MVGFNPSFRIQGQVYHLIGSIAPTQVKCHKFALIYFTGDEDSQVATRFAIVDGLKPNIIWASTDYYMKIITMQKCLNLQRRSLKKILPLM